MLIDGGFRRGTDVFKALALGASAVGIARPYLWGLGAFGQRGVARVIELLRAELATDMGWRASRVSRRSIDPSCAGGNKGAGTPNHHEIKAMTSAYQDPTPYIRQPATEHRPLAFVLQKHSRILAGVGEANLTRPRLDANLKRENFVGSACPAAVVEKPGSK